MSAGQAVGQALKVVSTDAALNVISTIFELTGARATNNAVGLDRFWRNVRTHTLHDPVVNHPRPGAAAPGPYRPATAAPPSWLWSSRAQGLMFWLWWKRLSGS